MRLSAKSFYDLLKTKRVALIGAGVSHLSLIRLLAGYGVSVTVLDRSDRTKFGEDKAAALEEIGVTLRLGDDYLDHLTDFDIVFRTPGMYYHNDKLTAARRAGVVITSEMECFFRLCPCKIVAVTGSDGKTTTTTMIAELLRRAGKTVHLGGNIGHPLLAEAGDIHPEDIAVLELSSFQLMTMTRSPHIAVITNLAPNHLDVHRNFAEYIAAKENIFTHQMTKDIAVFNADNTITAEEACRALGRTRLFSRKQEVKDGVFLRGEAIIARSRGQERQIMTTNHIKLPGVHNVENYLAAISVVDGMVPDEIIQDFAGTFQGVEHRIELIRTRKGVRWYNDSIASSPSRTIAGLNSFHQKVILIAGGKDKGISYESLGPVINERVKLLLLCGATAGVIRQSVEQAANYNGLEILDVEDYQEAVSLADSHSREGDVVILSPASTSFDRFANFMDRGKTFKNIVNQLP